MCSLSLNSCPIVFGSIGNSTDRCARLEYKKSLREFGWVLDENPPRAAKTTDARAKFNALYFMANGISWEFKQTLIWPMEVSYTKNRGQSRGGTTTGRVFQA